MLLLVAHSRIWENERNQAYGNGAHMALFPRLGPEYYDEKDRAIRERIEAFYAESITLNESFWTEADTDTRFEAGDQTLWQELYGNLPASRRKQFNFNRIRRIVNMISGHQRRNRKSIIVTPVENGDQQTADQFSKILMWQMNQEGVLETVSEAFHGSLVTGMNLLHVWMDYRVDPISGAIRVDNCPYNTFLIDPFFRKPDLSDCNAIWKRSFLTKRGCISLLPDREEEIASLSTYANKDGKFQFMPESYDFSMTNLLTYDEFYYRDYRRQKLLVDSTTGATMEWPQEASEDNLKLYMQYYPQISVINQEIPTVRLAIMVAGKVMYDGPNPMGIDMYPFVPVFSYYNPQIPYYEWRVQGVVRGLRDAQYLYNRRKVIELDILESQINSGWKYKENALVDPKDVFLAGQGKGLALKEDAQMTDVEKIQPADVPPSMMQLSEILGREIQEISGVNEELLGSAVDDKAGILSMLRQGAGLTTLQKLFDQLDYAQRILGRLFIKLIQNNFVPGKVERIIAEQPTPEFYNKAFGTYDAAVEEGFNTTTQRQLQFAQLLHLREVGVPVPDETLLEAATVQNKGDIIKVMEEQKQQAMQQQQQQMELQQQQQEAETRLYHARATADEGLGVERMSRVQENQQLAVERASQAEENKAQAEREREKGLLDMVKVLQEIETVDLANLEKVLALAQIVRAQNKEEEVRVQQEMQQRMQMQSPQNLLGMLNQLQR